MTDHSKPETELLPCPFCGAPAQLRSRRDVHCMRCFASRPVEIGHDEDRRLVEGWNTRTIPAQSKPSEPVAWRWSKSEHVIVWEYDERKPPQDAKLVEPLYAAVTLHESADALMVLAAEIEDEADNISPTHRTHPAEEMMKWARKLRKLASRHSQEAAAPHERGPIGTWSYYVNGRGECPLWQETENGKRFIGTIEKEASASFIVERLNEPPHSQEASDK